MKKMLFAILVTVITMCNVTANAQTNMKININGNELICDPPAVVENDRLLVPMRAIFEKLNAQINWDPETQTVTAAKNDFIMLLQIGNLKMFLNAKEIDLDAAPKIVDDRTMVPIRVVTESFGIPVEWDGETREVTINY